MIVMLISNIETISLGFLWGIAAAALGMGLILFVVIKEYLSRRDHHPFPPDAAADIILRMSSTYDLGTVLQMAAQHMARIFPADQLSLLTYHPRRKLLIVRTSAARDGSDPLLQTSFTFSLEPDILEDLFAEKICVGLDRDSKKCPLAEVFALHQMGTCLCCALRVDGKIGGMAVLISRRKRRYSARQMKRLRDAAAFVELCINHIALYTKSQKAQRELKRINSQIKRAEKFKAIGELTAAVTHDFNNLLAIVLGRTQDLMRKIRNENTLKGLVAIESAARDALKTVRRIQDFVYDKSNTPETIGQVNINQIIEEIIQTRQPHWTDERESKEQKIYIKTELKSTKPVNGDSGELREALTNIINNAIDAMDEEGSLTIRTLDSTDNVGVIISDTGRGMSAEVRSHIFDPFFTTKGSGGMGLGMSIVHSMVKRYGGFIKIESEAGKGTTVTISLPYAAPQKTALPDSQPELFSK